MQTVASFGGADGVFSSGITDLDIETVGGQARLYAVNRSGGGISAYDLTAAGAPRLVSQQALPTAGYLAEPEIEVIQTGTLGYVLPFGMTNTRTNSYMLTATGAVGGGMGFGAAPPPDLALTAVQTGAATGFLFGAASKSGQILVFRLDANGTVQAVADTARPASEPALTALAVVETASGPMLLAASRGEPALTSYRIGPDGTLTRLAGLGTDSGVGFAGVTALAEARIGGQSYVIVAASDSNSLSVLRLEPDGALVPVDHVIDGLGSRFATTTVLEVVEMGDRIFVVAAGGDDGLSLFTLLPDGRLILMASLADTTTTMLDNVSAVAVMADGDRLRIFVASGVDVGITEIAVDIPQPGPTRIGGAGVISGTGGADLLVAGPTTTELSGGAGDDMLVSAGLAPTLRGGTGADTFVLSPVAATVQIVDFQPGVDVLDLTSFPMLRSLAQVAFTATATGATLRIGSTVIAITSLNRTPLTLTQLPETDLFNLSRVVPQVMPRILNGTAAAEQLSLGSLAGQAFGLEGDDTLIGSTGDDQMHGDDGFDSLTGGGGRDELYGGTGNDTLIGGAGADTIWGGFGFDTVYGGDGNDTILGEGQADFLHGDAGNDRIDGAQGFDVVSGGAGNDTLDGGTDEDWMFGGPDNDIVRGGDGHDFLYGGVGFDTISGGNGNDRLIGEGQADQLAGESGNDTLFGEQGFDVLSGGPGNDELYGGTDEDWIFGGTNLDLLFGGDGTDFMFGGLGVDTLYGGTGNDQLNGEGSDDTLAGDTGNDTLIGGTGNDLLFGGSEADLFVFSEGTGHDIVQDYALTTPGERIDLRQIDAITDFADLIANHLVMLSGNAVIDLGGGNQVTLTGIAASALTADDFLL